MGHRLHFASPSCDVRRLPLRPLQPTCEVRNFKGELILRARRSRLRGHVGVFSAPGAGREVLRLRARWAVPLSAEYQVVDLERDEAVGGLRRKGFRSLIRDDWRILSPSGEEIGRITEDRLSTAVDRRFFDSRPPQDFHADVGGVQVCVFEQHAGMFALMIRLRILPEAEQRLDPRVAVAAAIALCLVEGKQRPLISGAEIP